VTTWPIASPTRNRRSLVRRLRSGGASDLSEAELLRLVVGPLGADAAARAVQRLSAPTAGNEAHDMPSGLGLPPAQAARLAAAFELFRRFRADPGLRPPVNTPREVWGITADLRGESREHFVGLYLNARNRLIARETVSIGSLNAALVHPREVYAPAIRHRAASLVVVHNHPSGETDPSDDDVCITRRLAEAGEILGIRLVDHVIVGWTGFTSLREAGHL